MLFISIFHDDWCSWRAGYNPFLFLVDSKTYLSLRSLFVDCKQLWIDIPCYDVMILTLVWDRIHQHTPRSIKYLYRPWHTLRFQDATWACSCCYYQRYVTTRIYHPSRSANFTRVHLLMGVDIYRSRLVPCADIHTTRRKCAPQRGLI